MLTATEGATDRGVIEGRAGDGVEGVEFPLGEETGEATHGPYS